MILPISDSTMYFIGLPTLFFTLNSTTECRITMEFLHIFLDPEAIFNSDSMFINAPTKEFSHINIAIQSYDISFEHILYCRLAPPIL